ncbi:hypothetical protein [Aquiflexum gelatinilyticum]|uniref:hypothetical protein n=1 Tax=Aquiflexum gelatinilyticum TaxID=2961943 RepID=UPI002169A441|nr:hypothetical protein [Aquiflexum gelatinilyticum]MCS4434235.1 hypothetical protein [Aquiflexum gelatinilyticum]
MKRLIFSMLFGFLAILEVAGQELYHEEYAVINEKFNPSNFKVYGDKVELFYHTSEIRFWVGLLRSERNIILGEGCPEVEEFIKANIGKIEYLNHSIPNLRLDPSRLKGRIELTESYSTKARKITFPLIIDDYAFFLMFFETDQIVVVLRKDPELGWRISCNIILYVAPLTDIVPIKKE